MKLSNIELLDIHNRSVVEVINPLTDMVEFSYSKHTLEILLAFAGIDLSEFILSISNYQKKDLLLD
ncbi:hypothetical protein [Enterococcus sp. HY326]|uniref:hypothetical protein n=1 Tax=Enterococcus sp. HY326 TaxID=2971265 RepID=UPI00223F59D8|nr:hypothetical protein [Enterococcus sp. HY326]